MKIQYKKITEDRVQITTVDERWYVDTEKGENDEDIRTFFPSVTWITSYYPKGKRYEQYIAEKGWTESQKLLHEAGDKGSKVHKALDNLLLGEKVNMEDKYFSELTNQEEELTVEEWECIISFAKFYGMVNPITITNDFTVFNFKDIYAGTVDWIMIVPEDVKEGTVTIKRGVYLPDFKTSPNIYPSHEIQLSAYKHGLPKEVIRAIINTLTPEQKKDTEFVRNKKLNIKLAILQIGYSKNKNGFKFTEIEDQYPLFLSVKSIWQKECGDVSPRQVDYPKSIILKKEEDNKEETI
jgi:hypothetical protein